MSGKCRLHGRFTNEGFACPKCVAEVCPPRITPQERTVIEMAEAWRYGGSDRDLRDAIDDWVDARLAPHPVQKDSRTVNTFKGTPGPWQVSGVRQRIGGEPVLMVGPDSAAIAAVFYSDRTPADHVASHADARLIASAPALLAALEEIARQHTTDELEEQDDVEFGYDTIISIARAALALASTAEE